MRTAEEWASELGPRTQLQGKVAAVMTIADIEAIQRDAIESMKALTLDSMRFESNPRNAVQYAYDRFIALAPESPDAEA